MPRMYYLDEPDQYFMTDIKVRHHNKFQRSQWQMAFRSNAAHPPPQPTTGRPPEAGAGGSAGRGGGGATGGGGRGHGGAGLHGQALSRKEFGRSLDHRPRSPANGQIICWDNASWKGCQNATCPHSHKPIGKVGLLDKTAQKQLIKRGGPEGGLRMTLWSWSLAMTSYFYVQSLHIFIWVSA